MAPISFEYKLFAGSHVPHVTSSDDKKRILEHFRFETGITLPEKHYPKLNNQNSNIIKDNRYYAVRVPADLDMYMYFTTFEGYNYCFLLGKFTETGYDLPKCILLHIDCHEDVYNLSVFDFTRVFVDHERFVFIFTNVYWFLGEKNTQFYLDKIGTLINFLDNYYNPSENQPFPFQIASPYTNLHELQKRNFPYKHNRILFYPKLSNQQIFQITDHE